MNEEFDGIVSVAKQWIEMYPEDKEQCLRVAISEYDGWSDVDSGKLDYNELMKAVGI